MFFVSFFQNSCFKKYPLSSRETFCLLASSFQKAPEEFFSVTVLECEKYELVTGLQGKEQCPQNQSQYSPPSSTIETQTTSKPNNSATCSKHIVFYHTHGTYIITQQQKYLLPCSQILMGYVISYKALQFWFLMVFY